MERDLALEAKGGLVERIRRCVTAAPRASSCRRQSRSSGSLGLGGYAVAEQTASAGPNTWKGLQQTAKGYGYAGQPRRRVRARPRGMPFSGSPPRAGTRVPMTASWDPASWKGVQTVLSGFGYAAPVDGIPGPATNTALQVLARIGGYVGPYDGVLGPNSWKGVPTVLTRSRVHGSQSTASAGPNTWKTLQRIAQRGGYAGPVDGVPGPNTYAGLAGSSCGASTTAAGPAEARTTDAPWPMIGHGASVCSGDAGHLKLRRSRERAAIT